MTTLPDHRASGARITRVFDVLVRGVACVFHAGVFLWAVVAILGLLADGHALEGEGGAVFALVFSGVCLLALVDRDRAWAGALPAGVALIVLLPLPFMLMGLVKNASLVLRDRSEWGSLYQDGFNGMIVVTLSSVTTLIGLRIWRAFRPGVWASVVALPVLIWLVALAGSEDLEMWYALRVHGPIPEEFMERWDWHDARADIGLHAGYAFMWVWVLYWLVGMFRAFRDWDSTGEWAGLSNSLERGGLLTRAMTAKPDLEDPEAMRPKGWIARLRPGARRLALFANGGMLVASVVLFARMSGWFGEWLDVLPVLNAAYLVVVAAVSFVNVALLRRPQRDERASEGVCAWTLFLLWSSVLGFAWIVSASANASGLQRGREGDGAVMISLALVVALPFLVTLIALPVERVFRPAWIAAALLVPLMVELVVLSDPRPEVGFGADDGGVGLPFLWLVAVWTVLVVIGGVRASRGTRLVRATEG